MKKTELIMGMPITVEIIGDGSVVQRMIAAVFAYFVSVDNRFSTYKKDSEISRINAGLPKAKWGKEIKEVLKLCEQTRRDTLGYFDIEHNGQLDPSGLVKGWAIQNAAELLRKQGFSDFCIEAGGDIQTNGTNEEGKPWRIGIRNPFNMDQIVKVLRVSGQAVATSGTYIRGQHIYNPLKADEQITDVKSLTVIADHIYDADRFATAAFAMGKRGIGFLESLPGLEGYMIDKNGIATFTSHFNTYAI